MSRRVAVRALVTTTDPAARLALPQVEPPAADLEAFLAAVPGDDLGGLQRLDEMLADFHSGSVTLALRIVVLSVQNRPIRGYSQGV